MDRTPALVAMAVGVVMLAAPPVLLATGGAGLPVVSGLPAVGAVAGGALALFGILLALAGWFGRRTVAHDRLLLGLSAVGLLLVAVPITGVGIDLLTWAMVAALVALLGALPAVVVLFRASRQPLG